MSRKNRTYTEKIKMASERIKRRKRQSITFMYYFFFTVRRPKKLSSVIKKGFNLYTLSVWSYSVMVITQDSESCDPGSSPGRTLILHFLG